MDEEHWLNQVLDDVAKRGRNIRLEESHYGSADIVAKYCGFDTPPSPFPGFWQHGWKAVHRQLTPQYEMGEIEPLKKDDIYWVARKDQEEFLQDAGFHRAKAIGLPCVYVPESQQQRRQNSLLVMPAHSLDYTRHQWKFEEYADQIESIRDDFEEVIACVHQSCFQRGLWVDSFRKRGIHVVAGAHTSDPLTLHRLKAIISSFGYLTTNAHGSHMAYGAYWGAKVSIFGTYANMRVEDYSNAPFYQTYPELIGPAVEAINEDAMRENYPEFFLDHPGSAKEATSWGEEQVGADNRLSPDEFKKLLGWGIWPRLASRTSRSCSRVIKAVTPKFIRKAVERQMSPALREQLSFNKELEAIRHAPAGKVSKTNILGEDFFFRNGSSCAEQLTDAFVHEKYLFQTVDSKPTIIDGGADVGVCSLYWARLFPQGMIHAVEADPDAYELLAKNCGSLPNVTLHNAAMMRYRATATSETNVDASEGKPGQNASGICQGGSPGDSLGNFLDQQVDLLKLDIEESEVELLNHWRGQLANVERIVVRLKGNFDRAQQLGELFSVLKECGFRVHLHNNRPALQPFIYRPVVERMDQVLDVFAVKDTSR